MIYKFKFDERHFRGFKKNLHFLAVTFTIIPLICLGIIWYLFDYKYSFLTPFENNIDILFVTIISFMALYTLYYVFYELTLISVFKKIMVPNNKINTATLNSDCLIISSKGLERKLFLNEIISADFKDNEIIIKMNNDTVIVPLYFDNADEFSELLYEYIP